MKRSSGELILFRWLIKWLHAAFWFAVQLASTKWTITKYASTNFRSIKTFGYVDIFANLCCCSYLFAFCLRTYYSNINGTVFNSNNKTAYFTYACYAYIRALHTDNTQCNDLLLSVVSSFLFHFSRIFVVRSLSLIVCVYVFLWINKNSESSHAIYFSLIS